jgi:integrase
MVRNAKPGQYADGNGLYLVVDDSGARRWILRTFVQGKRCEIGLGGCRLVTLKEAREEALRLRKIARAGGDPLAERRREHTTIPIFETVAHEVHAAHARTFRNDKHAAQWITSLETYAFPVMGAMPVNSIESKEILEALMPIWSAKPETARRVKQRLVTVFDYAKAKGWIRVNPADGIKSALPKHGSRKQHHAALPYADVPAFVHNLHSAAVGVIPRLAFEFLILTAARTGEVVNATWSEIDTDASTWTIPANRMKMQREHRVPLSGRCLEILAAARERPVWSRSRIVCSKRRYRAPSQQRRTQITGAPFHIKPVIMNENSSSHIQQSHLLKFRSTYTVKTPWLFFFSFNFHFPFTHETSRFLQLQEGHLAGDPVSGGRCGVSHFTDRFP